MTTTATRVSSDAITLVSETLSVSRDTASRKIKAGCPTTSADEIKTWLAALHPRITARVLEVLENRLIVARTDALMTGIVSLKGVKLEKKIRGCRSCLEALQGLRGEADLTPREKKHGTRVLSLRRSFTYIRGQAEPRLTSSCGTCGHRLGKWPLNKIATELINQVPPARIGGPQ